MDAHCTLTAGPNKYDLMLSLFEGKEVTVTRDLPGQKIKERAVITSVKVSNPFYGLLSGSKIQKFDIEGTFIEQTMHPQGGNPRKFKGFYDAALRNGNCTVTDYSQVQRVEYDEEDDEEQGTPEDASTDFVDSWSPVHGVILPEGHPDHDGHA